MPFKGVAQKVHRTSRQRAIEIGTNSSKFASDDYDAMAGIPAGTGTPSSDAKDVANKAKVIGSEKKAEKNKPFKVTK